MKILNISNMPIWLWGAGKGIPSIFFPQREFARKGFAACFLCPIKSGEKAYEVNEGVFIHRFDFPFNFKKNRYVQGNSFIDRIRGSLLSNLNWLFFQVAGLIKGLEIGLKFRPDIIYAHSLTSVFPAFILSRVLSSKLIIRVYGTRQLYWLWDNLWYRVKECRDYLAFRVPADYFIITNDGNMGNLLAKKMGVPDEKIKYWRNGIDDNFLSADADAKENICKELDIPLASKIIASTCRLIPDYGVEDMLKSLITVLNKNKDVVCIISGSGPEEDKLKEYVRENRMEKQVFFLGIVDRNKVKQILTAADIFVLLARFHNCTNTVWEAMAAGKCIVTTETEAIKEVLINRENAVLIKRDKLDDAAAVIEELLNNAPLKEKLAANVQSRARQVLESWPKRMEKEIVLLEELINRVR